MIRIFFILSILISVTSCYQDKPSAQSALLTAPLATDKHDAVIKKGMTEADLSGWIKQFNRQALENNASNMR